MKTRWIDFCEVFDSLRVVPRLILFLYGYWMARITDRLVSWFERLPAVERTASVTVFLSIVLPGVFGLAVWVYKIYAQGGRKWDWETSGDTNVDTTVSINK